MATETDVRQSLVEKMRDFEIEALRNDLATALGMLADWCVAVERSDEWDEHYTDASYRDGPLRAMLDRAIDEARARRA